MKKVILFVLGMLWALDGSAQPQVNARLKHELDSIYVVDQRYREMMMKGATPRGSEAVAAELGLPPDQAVAFVIRNLQRSDSTNMKRVGQVIDRYGYPGKALVGEPTNEAAFYVIQHSPLIERYLPLVRKAAAAGELPFHLYAMMLDRQLMYQNKPQVYGTQARGYSWKNPATGLPEQRYIVWPIQNAAGVNARRRKAGFPQTVEENAQRLRSTYNPGLTLAQVAALLRQ